MELFLHIVNSEQTDVGLGFALCRLPLIGKCWAFLREPLLLLGAQRGEVCLEGTLSFFPGSGL